MRSALSPERVRMGAIAWWCRARPTVASALPLLPAWCVGSCDTTHGVHKAGTRPSAPTNRGRVAGPPAIGAVDRGVAVTSFDWRCAMRTVSTPTGGLTVLMLAATGCAPRPGAHARLAHRVGKARHDGRRLRAGGRPSPYGRVTPDAA
jgi:hypothetical protein